MDPRQAPIKNPLAGASALSEYSWKYLTCSEVSAYGNYKSKHGETTIKNLCLWGKSEFHFVSPFSSVLNNNKFVFIKLP